MSTFEALKLAYLRSTGKDEPGVLALLAFGSISGSVGATSVYPLNLVRTRLQASGSSGHPQRYTGVMDVVFKTWERDGWRGFYRGLFPTLAKVRCLPCQLASHALDDARELPIVHKINTYPFDRWSLPSRSPTSFMNIPSEGACPTALSIGQTTDNSDL